MTTPAGSADDLKAAEDGWESQQLRIADNAAGFPRRIFWSSFRKVRAKGATREVQRGWEATFTGIYTGYFSYPGDGHVYGTLTGYTFSIGGVPQATISGLDVDAHLAEDSIQSGQPATLFQAALAGNDQFYLSTGIYTLNGEGGLQYRL